MTRMTRLSFLLIGSLLCTLALQPGAVRGQAAPAAPAMPNAAAHDQTPAVERDGQHDFDFLIGSWKAHLRRLDHPLTGSTHWTETDGTSVTRKVWDGRANLEEFEADGPAGAHLEGLTLRLYNPEAHQWSLYWGTSKSGNLGQPAIPMTGRFKNGRGEFFDQELFQGKAIYVRYIWSDITPRSCRFEQSFSADGGATWEPNWIATFERIQTP
jgi:hypothetical protein